MRRRTKETLVVSLLFAAVATLFFGRSFSGDRHFVPMHTDELIPWSSEVDDATKADIEDHHFLAASDKLISFRADDANSVRFWRDGQLPLWNPTNAGGVSHLGQGLYGVFYPFHALFRFVSPERAYGILAALHHFLLALFTYLYVRRIGGGREGAVIAALGFSFSTCLAARAHYYHYLYTFTWLPLGLLLVDTWLRLGSRRALVCLAPVTTLVLLVAWPQVAAFTIASWGVAVLLHSLTTELKPTPHRAIGMVAVAVAVAAGSTHLLDPLVSLAFWPFLALALVIAVGKDARSFIRRMASFVGVIALGVAMSSIQYLPAAGWAKSGSRQLSAPEHLVDSGMEGGFLAKLLLPGAFGTPDLEYTEHNHFNLTRLLIVDKDDIAAGITANLGNPIETAHYFGLLPLALVLIGLFAGSRRPRLLFAALAVLFGGFALGVKAIVYPSYFAGFFVGNDPRRALIPFIFALACLAGLGWKALRHRPQLGRWLFGCASVIGLVLLSASLLPETTLGRPLTARWNELATAFGEPGREIPTEVLGATLIHIRSELLGSGALLLLIGIVGVLAMRTPRRAWTRIALLGLIVADLFLAAEPYLGTLPAKRYLSSHPMIDHLRDSVGQTGRLARYDARSATEGPLIKRLPIPPNLAGHYGLLDAFCYTVSPPDRWMWLADQGLFAGTPIEGRIRGQVGIYPLYQPEQLSSKTLDLMAVKAILGTGPIPEPLPAGIVLDRTFDDGASWVLRNERALPRAFTVATIEDVSSDSPEKIVQLRIPGQTFDPSKKVLLEGEDLPSNSDPANLPTAEIVSEKPEEIRIALSGGDGPGVLVNLDTYAPGWEAEIDGKDARILRANFAFRGIPFPAGAKEIVLRYRPRSVWIGMAISILALIGTFFALVRVWRR